MTNFIADEFGTFGAKLYVKSKHTNEWERIGEVSATSVPELKEKAREHAKTWGKNRQGRILMECMDSHHEYKCLINPVAKFNTKPKLIAEFTAFPKYTNWVTGHCGDYIFQAKLFDEPIHPGIGRGRIAKLTVCHKTRPGVVFEYDRGWNKKAGRKYKSIYNAIIRLLSTSKKRFN